mgnify:CR=1 FL=1
MKLHIPQILEAEGTGSSVKMCNVNLTLGADILEDRKELIHQKKDLVSTLESMDNKSGT